MADPKHPEHRDLERWYGDDYDPREFDTHETSELLRMLMSRKPRT